jgi:hypothetical protein
VNSIPSEIQIEFDPRIIPTLPAPRAGERIVIEVAGLPAPKDVHFSIRNPKHRNHDRFKRLRIAATDAMADRRWFHGPVAMTFVLYAPQMEVALVDYVGGVMDTLDGSHGCAFTYLPIVYQDDCQICSSESKFIRSDETKYVIEIVFLQPDSIEPHVAP